MMQVSSLQNNSPTNLIFRENSDKEIIDPSEQADRKARLISSNILMPLKMAESEARINKYAYFIDRPRDSTKSRVIETKYLCINPPIFRTFTYEIGQKIGEGIEAVVNEIIAHSERNDYEELDQKRKTRALICLKTDKLSKAKERVNRAQHFYVACADAAFKAGRPVGLVKPFLGVPNDTPANQLEHGMMIMPSYQADLFALINDSMLQSKLNIHLDQATTLTICYYILCGVANIHAAGFIHGDIKPENIFLRWKNDLLEVGIADYSGAMLLKTQPMPTMSCDFIIMKEYDRCDGMINYEERYALIKKMESYALGKTLFELMHAATFTDQNLKNQIYNLITSKLYVEEKTNRLNPIDVLDEFTKILLAVPAADQPKETLNAKPDVING